MLHGKCWRTVFTHELLTYQRSERYKNNEWVNTVEALYMWYCVYYIHIETFIILVAFLF